MRYPYALPDARTRLIDRSDLVNSPEFWAIYLQVGHVIPDEVELDRCLGVDPDGLNAWYKTVPAAETEWPVIYLFLPAGRSAHVVFGNCPEDYGVDYLVEDPTWARAVSA